MSPKNLRPHDRLKEELIRNLKLRFFENHEAENIIKEIESLGRLGRKALALCLALSGASANLVPKAVSHIRRASLALSFQDSERWITGVFDLLDSKGLGPAVSFLTATGEDDLKAFASPGGLRLSEIQNVLETYFKATSGLDLKTSPDSEAYTDTVSVYLPPVVGVFPGREKNFLVYKLMTAFKWAELACGTFILNAPAPFTPEERPDMEGIFGMFPMKDLALDIYRATEAVRLERFLSGELPALVKSASAVKLALFEGRPELSQLPERSAFVEALYQHYLAGKTKGSPPRAFNKFKADISRPDDGPGERMSLLLKLYEEAINLKGDYEPRPHVIFLGDIKPEKVSEKLREKIKAKREKIEAALTRLIAMPDIAPPERPRIRVRAAVRPIDTNKEYISIKGRLVELDEELMDLIEETGGIPGGVVVKGSDARTGSSSLTLSELIEEEDTAQAGVAGGIKYDEWDYKRGGYRKGWCNLFEQDVHPSGEPFVDLTLSRYGGYVRSLRKKFELLRREPKLMRRQKDGEDIDIDSAVEAYADSAAGLTPTENVFVKLDRAERDIAVMFLLDMSGSTKGWISVTEKESLVLMSEALDALGDRYAIFGFSGMTRNKCDFYRIKGFDEPYGQSVKRRISGVSPKDYTRMGPAIRHAVYLLKEVEARTKLLITLSDGKPEDYDAYKGEYGIEDTRRALIEAKERGIHPFCVTIDKEGPDYLPHMYGEANYIVIDDVRKLPSRITEIYRRLTV